MPWNHTPDEIHDNAAVASFFGHRAAGLSNATTEVLTAAHLAPVCVTFSHAMEPGTIVIDFEESFPAVEDPRRVPDSVLLGNSPREEVWVIVIRGELGGASENDEYMLIDVDALPVGALFERIACNGTTHRFIRTDAGWTYERIEATPKSAKVHRRRTR